MSRKGQVPLLDMLRSLYRRPDDCRNARTAKGAGSECSLSTNPGPRASLSLVRGERASPLWCLKRCSRPRIASGGVKLIVGGDEVVLGDGCTGVLPLAKAMLHLEGGADASASAAGSGASAAQRLAGDWVDAGLAVGVGSPPRAVWGDGRAWGLGVREECRRTRRRPFWPCQQAGRRRRASGLQDDGRRGET